MNASQDFQVCETASGTFSQSISLHPNAGTGALDATVYVRMKAGLSQGTHSGSLTIACDGLEDIPVTLNGTVNAPNTFTISVSANPTSGGAPYIGNTPGTTQATFTQGQSCTVHANPATGYDFIRWTENGNSVSTNANYTFNVTANRNLVAQFSQNSYTISVSADPINGGTVTGGGAFHYGETCTVSATPNQNFTFTNWTENGNVVSTQASYQFNVTSNRTLVAHFTAQAPITYTVTVAANPTNGGAPYIGNTPGTTQATFNSGQSCTVHATANSGFTFTNWTENGNVVSTQANYTFTVNGNRTLVANFQAQPQNYTVTVTANPTNGGAPYIGNTPGTTQATFTNGQSCTVHANPSNGFVFDRWTVNGNQVSTNANYTFTVTSNRNLVAHFIQQYTIKVSASPTNGGAPYIGNTSGTTQATFTSGQSCTVHANPNNGYSFVNWTENGNPVSTNADYTFTVNNDRTLVANFTQRYTITVLASPTEGGVVSGGGTYQQGQQCTVIATASDRFSFSNWTENGNPVSYDANYTFTVNSNRTLVANFTPLPPNTYNINVSPNPSDGGTVTGGGTYTHGQQCTVKATANPGYTFKKWTENGNLVSTEANYRFNVTGSRTLVAQFQQQNYTITASADPVNGGTVTGDGTYAYGVTCILTATPNEGYTFEHWKKGNTIVSTEFVHSFEVTENASFTANFKPIHQYSITATAEPEEGGTVTGYGTYAYGITCILTATPNEGYTFEHWKKGNTIVSTELVHSFEVTENASFIANFKPILVPHYTISVSANPTDWGEVYIGDSIGTTESTFAQGKYCTVHAEANDGYTFINWTENDSVVSNDKDFQFNVTINRKLIANFKEIPCIELKDIEAKKHKTQYNDMVVLILVYPEAGYKYQWLRSDEENGDYTEIPGVTGQYYYKKGGIEEGYYKVRITKGECELVTEKPYKVQYPLKQLRIYPNPSRRDHNIVVVNDSDGPSQLSIYSTDGRLLHAQTVTDNQTTLNLNLPSGVYIAYLTDSDGYTKIGKLVIQ